MLNENGVIIDDGTVAARPRALCGHDDQRGRLAHCSLARGVAPVRMAGSRGVRDAGDDAVGDVRHRGPRARSSSHGSAPTSPSTGARCRT